MKAIYVSVNASQLLFNEEVCIYGKENSIFLK